jgi:glyoxylase-like metal-dependent hydrolase (beta-lactamase superfamily II)
MARRVLLVAGVALGVLVAFLAVGLLWAHAHIRGIAPELPGAGAVVPLLSAGEGPVRVSWINTASQRTPRWGVLERALDPTPEAEYVMSHPAFVLEWPDGRIFLIDVGMDEASAIGFGRLLRLSGGDRIEPLGSTALRLGDAVERVEGVGFTHLHTDHTAGVVELCERTPAAIPLFQTHWQAEEVNFTTRTGRNHLRDAGCLAEILLGPGPVHLIPGFPGLGVLAVGGHTPGSQVFVARVGDDIWIFTGDVVNNIDGVRHDLPKPGFYSLLMVPEATDRLQAVRLYLRELSAQPDAHLLVSHDQRALEASGIPAW